MTTVRAVFENGVLRPLVPLELPDQSEVEFEPRLVTPAVRQPADDQSQTKGSLIGLFADEAELMDQVMDSVNELRERAWRLGE